MSTKGACLRRPADLSSEAALEILTPSIEKVVRHFEERGLDRISGIQIEISEEDGGSGRNFAACRTDGRLLVLSPDLVHLEQATVEGILAHELGHAADFCYPARLRFDARGRLVLIDDSPRGVPTGQAPIPPSWIQEWEARDDDEVEGFADQVAEAVTGWKIGYAGPCLLQTVGRGIRPRPLGLR